MIRLAMLVAGQRRSVVPVMDADDIGRGCGMALRMRQARRIATRNRDRCDGYPSDQ